MTLSQDSIKNQLDGVLFALIHVTVIPSAIDMENDFNELIIFKKLITNCLYHGFRGLSSYCLYN